MNPNTRTWPRGVRGMMRMMVKGMNVSRSRAVRRMADTSRGLRVLPEQEEDRYKHTMTVSP
jgi:hypothetical protein